MHLPVDDPNQQQFHEPDYPAFPVVFQRNVDVDMDSSFQKTPIRVVPVVPNQAAVSLIKLTERIYPTQYPSLFNQPIPNDRNSLENFFALYRPIDPDFVLGMKANMGKLSILRVGSNKIYVGELKDKKCTGKSILIFKNGNLYEGDMLDNKRHGRGAYIQPTSGWYIGEFEDDHKNGDGLEISNLKSAYKGHFVNGLKHDEGLYVDEDGNIYEGTWKLGIMHGKGTLKTQKSIYIGCFVNWLKHGTGEEFFVNGDIYKGEYQNGRFDGIGTYQWKGEDAIYEGNFRNGLRHGKGKWSKGETKYNGNYSEGLKEGYGELYFLSGNFYKGNFIKDKKQGYGEIFWTDGSFYKGQWKNGTQNGKGQLYLAGSDIVSGIFQNSILVQQMPSIYEKQMQISNFNINDMLGKRKMTEPEVIREKVYSETKGINIRKKLSKIEESVDRKKQKRMSVTGPLTSMHMYGKYIKSPEKNTNHGDGCGTCNRRFESFRLKQQHKRVQNHENRQNSFYDH